MTTKGHSKTINAQIEEEVLARIAAAVRVERERWIEYAAVKGLKEQLFEQKIATLRTAAEDRERALTARPAAAEQKEPRTVPERRDALFTARAEVLDLRARLAAAEGEQDRLQDEVNYIESVCWWDGHQVTVKKLIEVMDTLKAAVERARDALKDLRDWGEPELDHPALSYVSVQIERHVIKQADDALAALTAVS